MSGDFTIDVTLPPGAPAQCRATVTESSPGLYKLRWTDFVANEWEFIETLPVVLMRLATLAQCAEHDFETFFSTDDVEFVKAADELLKLHTTAPS